MFRLRTLGGALIEGPGGPLTGAVSQRRRLALLSLIAASSAGISRDRIVALLWPESDDERARHALAQLLYTLRRDFGADIITGSATSLRLDRSLISSDVEDFTRAIAAGELELAAETYGGPFLDGFHLGGCPEFERWVDDERARLALAARRTLEALAVRSGGEGRHADAVGWWRRLAALDPYDARVALALMKALAGNGDRAGAIRHARTWQALADDELGGGSDPAIDAFVASLEAVIAAAPAQAEALTPLDAAPPVAKASVPEIAERRAAAAPAGSRFSVQRVAMAAAVAIAVTLVIYAARGATDVAERDRIIIADVENETGEPVFDRSIPMALGVVVGQSRRLLVLTPERIRETLRRMRLDVAHTSLDESVAREVALREGARFALVPSVRRLENGYAISARLVDPAEGAVLALETETAASQAAVIDALDRLGRKVRRRAGESARAIASRSEPLPRLTTASIAALEKFASGSTAFANGQWAEAAALWEDAVRIDSSFSTAYAALGMHAYFMNRAADGERWFSHATATLDGLPPREQLMVRARIESWRGNRDSSIVLLRTYLVEEPNDLVALSLLGYDYLRTERNREGVEVFRRIVREDSMGVSTLINLATVEKGLGEYDSAIAHYRRAFAIAPDVETENSNINLEYGGTWVMAGSPDTAEAIFRKMLPLGRDQRARGLRSLAFSAMRRGQYRMAAEHLEEAIRLNRASQAGTSEVRNRLLLATSFVQRGLRDEARTQLDSARAISTRFDADPILMFWLGKALVRFGDAGAAQEVHTLLESRRNPANVNALAASEALRGEILIEQGQPEAALQHLKTALLRDSSGHTLESLAYGHARAGRYEEARTLYEELAAGRVFGFEVQELWHMAPFYLARIAEQMGDRNGAVAAYTRFVESWPEAEPTLPALLDAHSRLAMLRSGVAEPRDRR